MSVYRNLDDVPRGAYDILYADPPWFYDTPPDRDNAASAHYRLMSDADMRALPIRELCTPRALLFLWVTCPRLDFGLDVLRHWGFHYRGVAFAWVKTARDGLPLGAKGIRPTTVKPLIELVLVGSTVPTGRPLPVLDEGVRQTVFAPPLDWGGSYDEIEAPPSAHSVKPVEVRERIDRLYGPVPRRLELFARGGPVTGWDRFGDEVVPEVEPRETLGWMEE